ncbi:MAG: YbaK/EbsC family protein [Nocardioidaceae bacterium]|nr:YbaK/EbsC family protein [Nocardioidaceae bacterium]
MTDHDLSHPGIDRVIAVLRAKGWDGRVRTFPDGVRTAAAAAAALGCHVGAIANSLLFDADGSPVLILTSGAHRVDVDHVAATIGVGVLGRASPEFVRIHTGQAIGGVAPIGHPAPVPTYLDRALAQHDVIWAAAGHAHAVFPSTYDELLTLTGAVEIDVA